MCVEALVVGVGQMLQGGGSDVVSQAFLREVFQHEGMMRDKQEARSAAEQRRRQRQRCGPVVGCTNAASTAGSSSNRRRTRADSRPAPFDCLHTLPADAVAPPARRPRPSSGRRRPRDADSGGGAAAARPIGWGVPAPPPPQRHFRRDIDAYRTCRELAAPTAQGVGVAVSQRSHAQQGGGGGGAAAFVMSGTAHLAPRQRSSVAAGNKWAARLGRELLEPVHGVCGPYNLRSHEKQFYDDLAGIACLMPLVCDLPGGRLRTAPLTGRGPGRPTGGTQLHVTL